MERRTARSFRSIAPVRLYLEDVEAVVAYLQELSPEADVTIKTSGHEFVDVEELSGVGQQEVGELEIECRFGSRRFYDLLVSIGPGSVLLCSTGDTPVHRRILLQVETLLLARRRGWQWRDRLAVAAGITGPLSAALLMLANPDRLPWLFYAGVVLAVISLSLCVVYLFSKRWSTSQVILLRWGERRVHWGDVSAALITIALVVAMALVTLLLAFLSRVLV